MVVLRPGVTAYRQKEGSVPRGKLQEPDEQRLLGLVWRLGGTRMLLLALMPHHSGQGKAAPGHGATMMDSSWVREHMAWRGQCFPGGALLCKEPWEHPVPPASSSAGSLWSNALRENS